MKGNFSIFDSNPPWNPYEIYKDGEGADEGQPNAVDPKTGVPIYKGMILRDGISESAITDLEDETVAVVRGSLGVIPLLLYPVIVLCGMAWM